MISDMASLFAVSDLHVSYAENRSVVDRIQPQAAGDWLIVAGDVGEMFADIERTLVELRARFDAVVWVPGNHELWTPPRDRVKLRGVARYEALVRMCRDNGVLTPEDDFPIWAAPDGAVCVAPLFQLYDYSFRPPGTHTKEEALDRAYRVGVVCSDEKLLHADPFPAPEFWCWDRLERSRNKLDAIDPQMGTVLVSHWPLVRRPTRALRFPAFAQWCGTELTADWHLQYRAVVAVYGHLHIPRTTSYDGVRFEEVSLGYPAEWGRRAEPPHPMRLILEGASA